MEEKNEYAEKLAASLAHLEMQKRVLDHHSVVSETDVRGLITYVNDEFCRLSGFSREELIGQNHHLVSSGLHSKEFWRDMYATIARGGVWQAEVCNRAKDGSLYWLLATNAAARDATGKTTGYISIRTDITVSKARERVLEDSKAQLIEAKSAAEAATAAKSEFLATMSHEIRTPMNGVMGMLGLLLETGLSGEQRKFARTARESADGLLTIINDILDYSKLEAGAIELEHTSFSVSQVVDGVTSLLSQRAESKGLELIHALPSDLPPWLVGDPTRLRQILFNLVGNAIKFTHEGSVRIVCNHRALADDAIEVRFEVTDTGIGLSEEARARLFTRFSQADSSTTRKFGGTGLGLAISKQLAELMGGEIGVESELGSGSYFWFTIKSSIGECPIEMTVPAADAAVAAPARKLRILVADDNHVNQMFVTALLAKRGHTFDVVGNGAEAVEAVRSVGYDIVLMDVQMPVMDGPTATRAIREIDGPASRIPIIALTANAMRGQKEEYLAAGMNGYVTKPIDPSALFSCIAGLVPAQSDARDTNEPERARKRDAKSRIAQASPEGDGAGAPLFDEARLAELRECFATSDLHALLGAIPDEGGHCLRAIKDAIAANDLDAARRAAHRLKGMAGNLGATRITALARRIELEAPAIADVRKDVARLEKALDDTQGKIALIV